MSVSRDFPLYEVMRKRSPRAARWWIVGDRLYHVGLLMTMLCIPALFFAYTETTAASDWIGWLAPALILSLGLFGLGIYCKGRSYRIALTAGIDINKF
jgi:hypothetical protein